MFRLFVLMLSISAAAVMTAETASAQRAIPGAGPAVESARITASNNTRSGLLGSGSELRPDRDTPQSMQSYAQMLAFGRCSAGIGRKSVSNALAAQPNSPTERRSIFEMQDRLRSCQAGNLTRIGSLQRGSLAEGLYRKSATPSFVLVPLPADTAGFVKFMKGEKRFNALREPADIPMITATNCLVSQEPLIADRIVASTHGTRQEEVLMNDLFRKAPICAGAVRPVNISRSFLRAFLADSLQRFATFEAAEIPQTE